MFECCVMSAFSQSRQVSSRICLVLAYLLLFITAPTLSFSAEQQRDKVTIQLKWLHQFQFAGYYAAIEKGFYAEEDLEVELRQRVPGTSHLNDVLQGRAQYGTADAGGLLIERLQGKPVVLLAQIFQQSPLVLVTRKDSGIRAARDLAGKRITIDVVGHSDMPLIAMLQDAIGSLDAVEIQPHSFNPQDLIDGKTDAYGSYITNHPDWFRQHGVAVNIINPRDYGIDFYGDNLFTTEQEINEHPERVQKIRRATLKGWHYALDNRDEIIDLILKKYNAQGTNREHLAYEARETEKLILHDLIELGSFELDRYQNIAHTYAKAGYAEKTMLDPTFFYQSEASQQQAEHLVKTASIRGLLSREQKQWLETRPTVVARVSNFPPFHFMDQGKPAGFSVDLIDRIARLAGFDIQYVWDISWPEGLEHVRRQDGEVDLLLTAMNTAERREFMAFSKDYLELPFKIFTQTDNDSIKKIEDLIGKTVAIEKGFAVVKKIRHAYPGIHVMEVDGHAPEALRAVSLGDADAYIGNLPVANYHVVSLGLVNLKDAGNTPFGFHTQAFGVRKDRPELVSILNTAMAAIPFQERLALQEKWGLSEQEAAGGSEEEKVILTDKERSWLKAYPEIAALAFRVRALVQLSTEERDWLSAKLQVLIRVGDYPPFHFYVDGLPQGISVNYMQMICMAYDLNCDYVHGVPIAESIASMQEAGGIAVQAGWQRNVEREKVAIFTPPYSTSPFVIFQREGGKPILGMKDLVDKRVVVERNYAIHKLLKRDYPELNLLEVDFSTTALEKLASGQADAYVGNIMVGHYLSLELGLPNIVVAAPAPFEPNRQAIAVRKDWPQLASIIDKSMAAITPEENKNIRNRWLSVGYVQKIDYALALKTALGFLILLAAVLAWNQSIRRQKMALAESETRLRKARDEAEAANQAKSVFLANMSHELRTPLNAILGFSQILLRDDTLGSEQEKSLSFINNGGNHLLVLINDILDLSKIESGKIEIHPQPFQFHAFLETIDSIMREQAAAKDLSFVTPKMPDLPEVIEADEFRLRQVLLNLINNAIKFTPSGEVRFSVSVTDKQDPANQTLRFEVIDMGIGIAKKDLGLVFQPFEQAGDFYKREEGSGLGLAISRKLVAVMGGELKVESELGKGSRFWFEVTFPVHKEGFEETVSKGKVTGYKGKRLTALVADDKPGNLILLQNMLHEIGFEVVTATDGRQEVELAIKVKPDIILTDLKMPVMDGNSAARAIRKVKELADTPIIAVSAGVMEMQKNESIQAGCNDFLDKPIELPALLNTLQNLLGLEWSYEKKKEETSRPAELVLPPLDEIKRLMQAADRGNITALKREISQVRNKDSKYHPFADKLEKWSSQYQLDKIVEFLKPYSEK